MQPARTRFTLTPFQSTLSMRRATNLPPYIDERYLISIHALHEESDPHVRFDNLDFLRISIHALHEESDLAADLP